MLSGSEVARSLVGLGFTHVVWIPDSYLGTWEAGLLAEPRIQLIRAAREGELLAIAAGLLLGGAKPVAILQCTGLFEAGDALRNIAHDLKLPLRLVVGVRSGLAYQHGRTIDTCPQYMEPFLKAWELPYEVLPALDATAFQKCLAALNQIPSVSALLIPE